MSAFLRTPSQGLKILEKLHQNNPYHQGIINNLINAYICFGEHDKAIAMIADIPDVKTDVQSLKFKAWVEHKNENIEKEQGIWNNILNKSFYSPISGLMGELLYRDRKRIEINIKDILLFCVERNEMLRLPFFLEYYRKLGITKFFFVDNNSDDGSFEFLLRQPDCYVFWSNSSYLQAGSGQVWAQYLINKYVLDNQWFLVIDADEFLVYPNCETNKISNLIKYLDKKEYTAIASYVLDMFPKNLNNQLNIISGDNLLAKSPYFYNSYIFNHQIESPYHKVRGGIFHINGQSMPINVTPLFKKTQPNVKFLSSRHLTTSRKIADITSTVLHFKFIGDFHNHAIRETKRKEHWGGGVAYQGYARLFENKIHDDFQFTDLPKTTKYQNSQQLVDLGLIQCPDDWLEFIKNEKNDE